jgi:TonB family protein
MAGLTRPPKIHEPSGDLVLVWTALETPAVRKQAWAISILVHAAALAALVALGRAGADSGGAERGFRSSTMLVAPPTSLTQTAPNRGRIGKEFSLDNLLPRPAVRVPPAIPPVARAAVPPGRPAPALPEPPKVPMTGAQEPGPPQLGSFQMPGPPPSIETEEKPKLAFETPEAPSGSPKAGVRGLGPGLHGYDTPPGQIIAEATRMASRPGASSTSVSDLDLPPSSGIRSGLHQTPLAGRTGTALELLSDPGGADFKPYLIRILAIVKRNWLAVIPETARQGRQGRVQLQFAVNRDGSVPKLVIATPSGTESLDKAAVAGVSASTPFPPLPSEFQGNQVRLQFTFSYNLK